jgi:hypothetical protein
LECIDLVAIPQGWSTLRITWVCIEYLAQLVCLVAFSCASYWSFSITRYFQDLFIIVGLLLVDCNITSNYTIFEKVGPIGVVLSIKVLMGETLGYIGVLANGRHGINNN